MNELTVDDLVRTFAAEVEENLATMEEALLALERRPDDEETINTVFRMAHSVKGGASCVGYELVAEFAHGAEDLLDRVRDGGMRATSEVVTTLLLAVDVLRELVRVNGSRNALTAEELALLDAIRGIARGEGQAESLAHVAQPLRLRHTSSRTVRVDTQRIDRMVDLSGEIAIARGRLRQQIESAPREVRESLLESLHESERLFLDLQELVMKTRMVAAGGVFAAFNRTVRDLARAQGKSARLVVSGGEVEIDHGMMEKLRDPIAHMVRNAIDHGIELPEVRTSGGKDPCGRITLSAAHDGGKIVIRLSDDGAGIDRAKLRERAGRDLNDPDLLALVFEPGFSTRDEINDVSGRGVGMDVVKRNVEALHGTVAIESDARGTTITLKLPLTLAIIEAFGVSAGGEHYLIPQQLVTECMQLDASDTDAVEGMIDVRGEAVPFLRLGKFFGASGAAQRENVVIVQCGELRAGIAVDQLHGGSQVVVKPIGDMFRGIRGLSGSAILGSGRVALILDVPVLLEQIMEEAFA